MPDEEISARQAQNFGGDLEAMFQAYKYKPTQADHDAAVSGAKLMNPLPGEVAPKYWKNIDPEYQFAHMVDDPYTTPGYGISYGFGPNAPSTVYGNPDGQFMPTSDGGKGGRSIGGIMQIGGSKSQGPQFGGLDSYLNIDHSKAVWDNNYGWIIPNPQAKGNKDDWVTQALMTAASLAAGAVGIPTWAMGLVQGAQGYGNGQSLGKIAMNIAPSLIGAGLGGNLNLPPEVTQALNAAKYVNSGYGAYKQFQQGNPIGGGLTIGKLAGNFIPTGG